MRRYFTIKGYNVSALIIREHRKNVRFALGKTGFFMRLPISLSEEHEQEHLKRFEIWIKETLEKYPEVQKRFEIKQYQTGDQIKVGTRVYDLRVDYLPGNSHRINKKGNILHLKLLPDEQPIYLQSTIKQLISRMVASDFLPEIRLRVHTLNSLHFKKPIGKVTLKYNLSNWGSCSHSGNINLSTRLLFAPSVVIDYVIIHELAHLVEMNHSDRFWKLIEQVMPNYEQQELWLKEHSKMCDF